MITGIVQNRRVFVELLLSGPESQAATIEFVLDTGFTGVTTLDKSSCVALSLPFLRLQPAGLADGSPLLLEVYQVHYSGMVKNAILKCWHWMALRLLE